MALNKDFKVKNGLTVTESLSVGGDSQVNALTATTFEALTAKFNKTIVSTTSALSVVNNGTGPALLVQQDGAQPIAHFIDKDGDDIIFHDDGKVSIGSRTAVEQLTVTGNISATGGIKVASTENGFVSAGRDLADIFVTEAGGGGSVTNVRGCEGITVANGTSDACVTLDLTELPDMTQTFVDTDEFIVLDSSTQKRKAASEIGVSVFNNDSNFVCTLANLGVDSTATELNTLSSTTFDVQTQLNQLSSIKQDTITGAATTIATSDLTAGRAIISNGSGKVDVSSITNTELDFLDGVCFNIQTQLQQLSSTAEAGDITSVTAGGGIKGGGSSGNVDVSIFPTQSAITSIKNTGLTIGRDDDNLIKFDANDQIVFRVGEGDGVTFKPSGEIEATSLDIEGNVDVNGSIETDGLSLSGTNVDASATEINQIHAITDGQVAANKAVVVNVDKDITGFNNITLAGELDAGSLHTDTVTVSEFNQLSNVSFDIQSQLGALSSNKLACTATAANSLLLGGCNCSTFEPALSPSNRLSATNIGTGLITNNEYNFLNGVDANIQTQLNQLSAGAGGGGTVTSITKGDGIQGSGAITTTGTIAVDPAQTTITSILATDLKIGEDDQTKIDFEDANAINFYADNAKQLVISDGALTPATNNDVDLGTSDLQFKDGYFDGKLYADEINFNGTDITSTAGELNQLDGVVVTPAEFNQLSSVTFDVQTQLSQLSSSKLGVAATAADSSKLGGVVAAQYQTILTPSSRLSATNISTGVVDNTEFNYLNGVTSPIQTQFAGVTTALGQKQACLTPSNRLSATNIGTGLITNTEFNYLDGVTSGIQAQITAKQDTVDSSNRLNADLIGTGVVSNTEFNCLNGLTSTTTELNQVSSVTFDVQTQLAALSAGSGGCQGTVTVANAGVGIAISNCTTTPEICVNSTVVRTTGAQDIGGKKTFTDDTTITGNLSVLGAFTCIDTSITTTSALSVVNAGTGPALFVQQDGSQPIAHFIDKNGDDIIFHDDGHLSIGTCTNCETLTVKDSISASNAVKSRCFVKDGGTNSQFLKGDGSVDSNSYLLAAGCAANSALLEGESADAFQDTITTSARIGANCVGGGTVSNSEFNQLSSVSFNIQTQLSQLSSSKLAVDGCAANSALLEGNDAASFQDVLTPSNRLSATNIGTGVVSNVEFNYLDGVTSPIQTQFAGVTVSLGTKQACLTPSNRLSATNIGTGIIDNTEFNYLNGVCFNIQSQLLALSSGAGGGGSVCQVTAGDGLGTDGANPITSTGTINIDAAQTTITSILATDLKIGEDDQTKIDFEDTDTINFYADNEKQLILTNGALTPATNNDVDLGSDALEFKDGYFEGKLYTDAINLNGIDVTATAVELNTLSSTTFDVQTQLQALSSNKLAKTGCATDSALFGNVLPAGYQTILTPSNRLSATNIGTGVVTNDDFGFLANTDSNIQDQLDAKEPIISASNRIGADCINGGNVSIAEFNQLSSVTSNVQTQINSKLATTGCAADSSLLQGNNAAYFQTALTPSNRLSATNIGSGEVSNVEFNALSSVTSNIQDQIDSKLATTGCAADSAKLGGSLPAAYQTAIGTSARIGANCVGDGTISDTEYGLLNGASFNLQSQLAALSSNKQATITGAATTITSTDLEDNRALITSSCKVAVSDITSTELNFLDGVCFNLQSQLAALSSGSGGCSGSVTSITAGSGLCGGTITNNGTISIDPAQTTITSILAADVKIGEDNQTKIDFEDADTINFYANNEKQLILTDGALTPATNNNVDLGTDALEFKDGYFDGKLYADTINLNGTDITATADEINQLDNVVVPSACFNQLSSVTSPVQPQLAALSSNKLAKTGCATDSAKLGNVAAAGYQTAIGTSARIGANCIGGGTVSNVVFNALSSVTSNIQDQIDSKLATTGCAADSSLLQGNNAASFQDVLTPSNRLSATNIGSGEVSNTEFNQLSSVTSNIQTQINSKLATSGCAADSALLQGNNAAHFQTAISTSARIGANCVGANSNISDTEYGFLNGVSSNIQTQLAALSAGSGGTDGTVTSVVAGTGLDGGTITGSGTISIEAAQPTITSLGTLTSLTVDDITINGSTISDGGTLTIDAAADIILDADGGDICLKDKGTEFGRLQNSSSDFVIQSIVSDKDIIFKGSDGGSGITALTLDMSDAGSASFNHDVTVAGDLTVNGDFTCKNTIVTITSALSVVNTGTGPALTVQQDGTQPIAHFIDKNGDDIIFHDDGHLSIGTRENCETLTVKDSISASGSTKARCFVKFGGTSSQFLKADGSVDSTSYGTGSVCTLDDLGIDASAGEINQLENVVIGGACFNQLSSVSSNVQTQIETKLATSGCAADSAKLGNVAAAGYQTAIGTSARIGANCIAGGSVSNTEFNQLSTVTSNIQTQINSKLATTGCAADSALLQGNNAAYFQTAIASDNKINADCIASGSVSNTEFNQLSTVTSNIQTQINSKLATSGCAADSALLQGNAASAFQDAIATDARIGANCIGGGTVSNVVFNALSSVTSNIQDQIDSKLATSGCAADSALLQGNAASAFQDAIATDARVGANCIGGGTVSNTEFNALSTVTSNIQTQINSKLATTGCAADSAKLGGSLPAAYQTAIGTSARIGANCIAGGSVSNTEFNQLSTVTSNIQDQIDSKLATTGCAADSALLQGNAASVFQTAIGTSARIGANCIGANSNISNTEYGFLNGVSSNIQTQLAALSAGSGGTDGTVTSVTAGTGMTQSGTNTINPTLNVIGGTGITANTNDIALDLDELATSTTDGDGDFFAVVDSSGNQKKLTKGNINNSGFNNDAGFATGTVTSVLGCTGITVTNGTGNACVSLTAAGAGAGTYGCTDDNIKIDTITLDAYGRITGVAVGNTGDINSVTAGVGLCGGGSSGSVTLTLDMSELTDMTADMVAADEFIVLDNGADRRKAACEIGLSIFDNDANFTSNTGDITSVVAGSGLTGGATSGDATLNVIAGTGICVTADAVCVDGTIVRTTGGQSIGGAKCFTSAMNATSITATGTVQAGCFVTGAFMESNAPADRVYPQGTLLALNEDGCVVESTQADSAMVFGVAAGDNKAPIVMGAEPVCITGEIEVGDYITTSDCKGHGKKAICPDFKAFGAIIGQAMESGCGESFAIKAMIRKM